MSEPVKLDMPYIRKLQKLRDKFTALSEDYSELLVGDGESEDTELQRHFGFLLWALDEETRTQLKGGHKK